MITTQQWPRILYAAAPIILLSTTLTGCSKGNADAEHPTFTAPPRIQPGMSGPATSPRYSGVQYSSGPRGLPGNTNFGTGPARSAPNSSYRGGSSNFSSGPGGLRGNTNFGR